MASSVGLCHSSTTRPSAKRSSVRPSTSNAQTGGGDAEVGAAVGALQPVAQSGAVGLDHEILDRQAGVGKGLPQRLVKRAQAVAALQAAPG